MARSRYPYTIRNRNTWVMVAVVTRMEKDEMKTRNELRSARISVLALCQQHCSVLQGLCDCSGDVMPTPRHTISEAKRLLGIVPATPKTDRISRDFRISGGVSKFAFHPLFFSTVLLYL